MNQERTVEGRSFGLSFEAAPVLSQTAVIHLRPIPFAKKARLIQPGPSSTCSWGHYLQFMSLQARFQSYNR